MLSDLDFLCSEIVNTRRSNFTLEHDSEFCSIGMVVDVLCYLDIDGITSDGEVDTELQAGDFFLETGNLYLSILELLQQFKVNFLRFVHFFFHLKYIIIDLFQLPLDLGLSYHSVFQVSPERIVFLFKSSVVPFVRNSDTLILSDDIFLLQSPFLIVRDIFRVLSLQIRDLLLLSLSELGDEILLRKSFFLILRNDLFLLLSCFLIG